MRNRGLVIFIAVVFAAMSLYYLSFTFVSRSIEKKANAHAVQGGKLNISRKQAYLDSIWNEKVFGPFTYKQIKDQEVKLGLDLKGGMHVTMEVSAADVLRSLSGGNPDPAFLQALTDAQKAQATQQGSFTNLFYRAFQKRAPGAKLATIFANSTNQSAINFDSPDADVLKYVNGELEKTIDLSLEVLRRRIDAFGVVQPSIQRLQGTNRIQIELPGVDDPKRVRKLLQGIAKLEFHEVWEMQEFYPYFLQLNDYLVRQESLKKKDTKKDSLLAQLASPGKTAATDTAKAGAGSLADQLAKGKTGGDSAQKAANPNESSVLTRLFTPSPSGLMVNVRDTVKVNELLSRPDVRRVFPANLVFMYDHKPGEADAATGKQMISLNAIRKGRNQASLLSGEVISNARPDLDPITGKPEVSMRMNPEGAKKWKKITGQNINKRIAIVLDNVVYSAPVVQGEIPGGNSQISGNFDMDEAKDLSNVLVAGKMPVPTRIVEEEVVGPTLGQEAINNGLLSIVAGLSIIILFMIGYYSSSGWIANLAVLLNILMIMGILVALNSVLTLPGIAGIVLTIGMAVDANVLINERVKDELRTGKSVLAATSEGYRAASSSIWDANITTLLAGFVLAFFGVGVVRGFAVTLIIGIATSLFTSIYVTRLIIDSRLRQGKSFSFFTNFSKDLFKNVNYDFVSKRKIAYICSSIFIGAGIVSMIVRGFDYGVDFKGGWTYVVRFDQPVNTTQVGSALATPLQATPEVKAYGGSNTLQITTTYLIDDLSETAGDRVEQSLQKGLASLNTKYRIESSAKVGPTIANDIKRSAIYAVVIAMAAIFGYILLRFSKWQYATGAIIAVVHDTLVILSVYSLFKDIMPFSLDVDQNFIAAVLTIIGFSVNDTVVVFDRVRTSFKENILNQSPATVVNKALNDTFSRTVITSTTVFLVVLILFLFGGDTIRGLSFALLVGVVTGSYSTIYIALPFVVDAYKRPKEAELVSK